MLIVKYWNLPIEIKQTFIFLQPTHKPLQGVGVKDKPENESNSNYDYQISNCCLQKFFDELRRKSMS